MENNRRSINEKMFAIQQALVVPKDQYNKFGNYPYRTCEGILEAVKPLLADHELNVLMSDDLIQLGDRYYVKATATLVDAKSGEQITVTAFAREEESKKGMDGSQVTGASSSYARKYALCGLFAIDGNKDSDETNTQSSNDTKPQTRPQPQMPKQTQPQAQPQPAKKVLTPQERKERTIKFLKGLSDDKLKEYMEYFKIEDVDRITDEQVDQVIAYQKELKSKK